MPTAMERLTSRSFSVGESSRGEFLYAFTDVPVDDMDVANVYAMAWAVSPPIWFDGLYKLNIDCDNQGAGVWYARVNYGPRKPREPGQVEWRLNIGTRTQHVTQSKETIAKYSVAGKQAPDYEGAINVTQDNQVNGCDVLVPTFEWEESWYVDYAAITIPWLNTLYLTTGKSNDAPWRFFNRREVLCLGCSGAPAGQQAAKFTFRFQAEPTLTDLAVGTINVNQVRGMDYLWVLYEADKDPDAHHLIRKPRAAYVERVLDERDFSKLGIPDPWTS